jgi:hypothetical protein
LPADATPAQAEHEMVRWYLFTTDRTNGSGRVDR